MVSYSFKRRFVNPICVGLGFDAEPEWAGTTFVPKFIAPKRQTIRADRKRHARPGEELQLYCGMRTKGCFLIGRARCASVHKVKLDFSGLVAIDREAFQKQNLLDDFARSDGFRDFEEMREFWRNEHGQPKFEGVLIRWEPKR